MKQRTITKQRTALLALVCCMQIASAAQAPAQLWYNWAQSALTNLISKARNSLANSWGAASPKQKAAIAAACVGAACLVGYGLLNKNTTSTPPLDPEELAAQQRIADLTKRMHDSGAQQITSIQAIIGNNQNTLATTNVITPNYALTFKENIDAELEQNLLQPLTTTNTTIQLEPRLNIPYQGAQKLAEWVDSRTVYQPAIAATISRITQTAPAKTFLLYYNNNGTLDRIELQEGITALANQQNLAINRFTRWIIAQKPNGNFIISYWHHEPTNRIDTIVIAQDYSREALQPLLRAHYPFARIHSRE